MDYRKELKYIVKKTDLEILKNRFQNIMKKDENTVYGESYNIRSIYFDTYDNTYFYDNESGLNKRFKIRIRIYNKKDEPIKLEIKHKNNGVGKKEMCEISREICNKLMNGEFLKLEECTNNELKKIYIEQHTHYLKPKIIVEYERTAWVNKIGNIRVTFDTNVRTSSHIKRFFEDNIYAEPVLESGKHILEVKYDELMPDYIASSIETNTLEQIAFSKYYLSRLRLSEELV